MIKRPDVRTSSCGRLFDTVAAICGIEVESGYEGESAMLLEAAAQDGKTGEPYPLDLDTEVLPWTVGTRAMLRKISNEIESGTDPQNVARCFHDSVALMMNSVCRELRERNGVDKICLSGGVFQNFTVLSHATTLLRRSGFQVFLHSPVPPNDGGISLGQAVIGAAYLERRGVHVSRNPR
jgi:hydrogenase maturation protein HypF